MNIILKNNLWSFKCKCVFCDQTHGRTKLPIGAQPTYITNICVHLKKQDTTMTTKSKGQLHCANCYQKPIFCIFCHFKPLPKSM